MNVHCLVSRTITLDEPTKKLNLAQPLAYTNAKAHAMQVVVMDEGEVPADLTGIGCTASFKRSDNTTVEPINGTVSGNVAQVILPASCYVIPGRFTFTMDLSDGNGATRTALWVDGMVEKNTSNEIVDPGTPVGNIEQAVGNANAAASAATTAATAANTAATNAANAAKYTAPTEASSTASKAYAVGDYFVYNGKLYITTSAIASGGTITPNTNCAEIPNGLSGEVGDLKSAIDVIEDNLNTIAQTKVEVTDYQIAVTDPDSNTSLKTNNIGERTALALCVSTGNIIKLPYFRSNNYQANGLTFTINSDGSITVNGTATADTTYNIAYYTTGVVQLSRENPSGWREYGWTLSGCTDGSDSTYYLTDVSSGAKVKTAPVACYSKNIRSAMNIALVIKSGVTLADKTFYPMASLNGTEAFAPPIPQGDQYTATVESTDTEYEWQNVQLKSGYNLIVGNGGNTITAVVSGYDTFANIHNEIDELKENVEVSHWKDKKWVAFGTSITDNYSQNSYITQGEHTGEHTGKYVPYLLDLSELSQSSFVNRGIAGGSINGHILYYIRYYTADQADADLITIEGAVNDFATSVPLGNVGDTVPYTNDLLPDSTSEGTFAGACYQAFTTALSNAPNAVVVLLTETTGKDHTGYANYSQLRKNSLDLTQWDYIDMTIKVAEFVGIPVIKCGQDSMINAQNPQYIADHIHHTYLGGYQYARTIWAKLKGIPLKALTVPE